MAITGIEVDGVMYDLKPVEGWWWCRYCAFGNANATCRIYWHEDYCPAFSRGKIFVKRKAKGEK